VVAQEKTGVEELKPEDDEKSKVSAVDTQISPNEVQSKHSEELVIDESKVAETVLATEVESRAEELNDEEKHESGQPTTDSQQEWLGAKHTEEVVLEDSKIAKTEEEPTDARQDGKADLEQTSPEEMEESKPNEEVSPEKSMITEMVAAVQADTASEEIKGHKMNEQGKLALAVIHDSQEELLQGTKPSVEVVSEESTNLDTEAMQSETLVDSVKEKRDNYDDDKGGPKKVDGESLLEEVAPAETVEQKDQTNEEQQHKKKNQRKKRR